MFLSEIEVFGCSCSSEAHSPHWPMRAGRCVRASMLLCSVPPSCLNVFLRFTRYFEMEKWAKSVITLVKNAQRLLWKPERGKKGKKAKEHRFCCFRSRLYIKCCDTEVIVIRRKNLCFHTRGVTSNEMVQSHTKMEVYFRNMTPRQSQAVEVEMMTKYIRGMTQNRYESPHTRTWKLFPNHKNTRNCWQFFPV